MAGEKPYPALRANPGEESDNVEQGKLHTGSDYSKTFSPLKQTWQLLADQLFRLVFTATLVSLTIITLKVYEQKGSVAHDDKIVFNTVITVLNLALGLNFLEAFKDMAKVLRWRVLANRRFTVRETDLILGGESLLNLATLMRESMRKPLTFSVCAFWETVFISSTHWKKLSHNCRSLDSSTLTWKTASYYNNGNCTTDADQPPEVAQNEAHAYGEASLRERACNYTTDEDIFKQPQNCTYFARTNGREFGEEFAFRYAEYNPGDRARAYPFLTKRLIKTSTGQCYQYKPGRGYFESSPDGPDSVSVWPYSNGTTNGLLRIARTNMAFDSTTYAYTGLQAPQNTSAVTCGPRCIWLYAARQNGTVTRRGNDIFMCPITVSEVSDAQQPAHEVPDPTARLAAASIALSGRYTNPNGNDEKHWQQFQWFPYGSFWETDSLPAQAVGRRMAEFAIGSLASMANYNLQARIPGTLPTLGYSLSMHWEFIIALAAVITGVHCLLVGLILFIASPIVIPADSNLVVAKMLGGLLGRVGERGNLLEAKEIAEAIEKEVGHGHGHGSGDAVRAGMVGYGVREAEPGTVLEIGEGLVRRKNLKARVFPRGLYA
ncbi:MAG: hypothetical protein Q9173_005772 [Seirophora scorigena]